MMAGAETAMIALQRMLKLLVCFDGVWIMESEASNKMYEEGRME